uniref:Vitellogenin receptor n=1 Tax=Timema cristinae TaxID=61476 RepID=A0A7R9D4S9_TIMCR|nr:unnamed protein product [Timema cristinae]
MTSCGEVKSSPTESCDKEPMFILRHATIRRVLCSSPDAGDHMPIKKLQRPNQYFMTGSNNHRQCFAEPTYELIRTEDLFYPHPSLPNPYPLQLKSKRQDKAWRHAWSFIFWTDWAPGDPSLSRANLDGSNVKRLFEKPRVEWPNGITIDHIAERIYWVDAKLDYIASAALDGSKFKQIIANDVRVKHPFAVAVFKDNLYWDDWEQKAIFTADKDHGVEVHAILNQLSGLMDLKVFAHSIQEGNNSCGLTAKVCSHLCVGLPQRKSACLCPDTMVMKNNECMCPENKPAFANGTCPSSM